MMPRTCNVTVKVEEGGKVNVKGINIMKSTMSDGSVIVKKIVVR